MPKEIVQKIPINENTTIKLRIISFIFNFQTNFGKGNLGPLNNAFFEWSLFWGHFLFTYLVYNQGKQ